VNASTFAGCSMIGLLDDRGTSVSRIRADLGSSLLALYVPDRNSRAVADTPDQSGRNRDPLSKVNTVATDGDGRGNLCYRTDGAASYLEMEDNLFDSAAQGSISIAFNALGGSDVSLLSDGNATDSAVRIFVDVGGFPNNQIRFKTDDGGGAEEEIIVSKMRFGEWITLGFEWGPTGKVVYLNGRPVGSDGTKTGAAGVSQNAPRIGLNSATFSVVRLRGFAYCSRSIGAGLHQMLHEAFYGRIG